MSNYIFDPAVLHEIARSYWAAARADVRVDCRRAAVVLNNAGGAMIQVCFPYISLAEYVMLCGTPIGTSGHSGRHAVMFYDAVLDGEARCFHEGQFECTVVPAIRSSFAAGRRRVCTSRITSGCSNTRVELSLSYGLADPLFSTLDFKTL